MLTDNTNNTKMIIMKNDIKCFFGIHRQELLEVIDVEDRHGEKVSKIYVTKCANCGKIITKRVRYEEYCR